jgi:RNA polymerase sigma-70 factor (ECF subfamily)
LSLAGRTERELVHDPDPRTLARARGGDVSAFEDLVRAYQADLWRFTYSYTRDHALAEDATQEAFIRAYRFLPSFRGDSRFTSWLFRIARNCALDIIRSRKSQEDRALRAPDPIGSPDPVTRLELQTALSAVSEDHREPFLLIEVFGLSYQEAADVLRVRVGTVKSRMHRARAAMMGALAVEEDAGEL